MAKKEYKKPLVYVQKQEKKEYQSPKATVYKSADATKAKKQANSGSGGSPHLGRTTVMGAISILLLIGLIATVFFA
ncbi:MAG: hypothetical protein IJW55_09485 [Clostridia bacterium]|nr:hypothetical protein [Clostridia bacterium]